MLLGTTLEGGKMFTLHIMDTPSLDNKSQNPFVLATTSGKHESIVICERPGLSQLNMDAAYWQTPAFRF